MKLLGHWLVVTVTPGEACVCSLYARGGFDASTMAVSAPRSCALTLALCEHGRFLPMSPCLTAVRCWATRLGHRLQLEDEA